MIHEPRIAGIARKNENFAASFDFIPNSKAVEIVIPDLEIPGNIARHCIQPIIKAIFQFNISLLAVINLVDKRIKPVIKIQ